MRTGTITSIENENNSWTSRNGGTFHDYTVGLTDKESGEEISGQASSTDPQSPPYAVGDEVFYESRPSAYGLKLKIKKEMMENQGTVLLPSGTPAASGGRLQEISTQWALGRATEVINYQTGPDYWDDVKYFATRLLEVKEAIIKG